MTTNKPGISINSGRMGNKFEVKLFICDRYWIITEREER
jgi:hypothetical protein